MALGKHRGWRQFELFERADVPAHVPRLASFARRAPKPAPRPDIFEGMGSWVRQIGRLLALDRPASTHYERFDTTARLLTAERIRACRHADDLARVSAMLDEANEARRRSYLHGLDRVWTKAELGALRVEVRNRLRQLGIGRVEPRPKGPRLHPTRIPADRLDALIQHHSDIHLVEALRRERARRLADASPA